MVFFLEIAKNSPKICMESQDSNIQSNSEKKNKAVAITFTDFKLNYNQKSILHKIGPTD